jgi:hypothetical protein
MQKKLSLLKKQIDRISRRESKTTSKGKSGSKIGKKSFNHSRTNSHHQYSYGKYTSNPASGINTANQSGVQYNYTRKKSYKSSKKKISKGHNKSNSFASGSKYYKKDKKESSSNLKKYSKDFGSKSKKNNVFNYREVRNRTKNSIST